MDCKTGTIHHMTGDELREQLRMSGADRKASEALQIIAGHVEDLLTAASGQKLGFCLVVFPVEPNSRASYISNCDRQEAIEAIKTLLEHWGGGMPDIPAHEVQ